MAVVFATDHSLKPYGVHVACIGSLLCCRSLCLVLEPNLVNQIAARVTLVDANGAKETAEDGEEGGALYHGYVEGEEIEGGIP